MLSRFPLFGTSPRVMDDAKSAAGATQWNGYG